MNNSRRGPAPIMNKPKVISIRDLSKCYSCKSTGLKESDFYCPNCGFPQQGTQVQMKRFLQGVREKKRLLDDKKRAIRKARNILFFVGAINLVIGVILGAIQEDNITIVASIIIAGIYFGLGIWCNHKPFPAILTGLIVYISLHAMAAIVDPTTIVRGVILKIIVIVGFVKGFKAVKESEGLQNELDDLTNKKDFTEDESM